MRGGLQHCPRPGEVDLSIYPPAVADGLRRVTEAQPPNCNEVFAGGLDIALVHTKNLGNPGDFTPATADAAVFMVVKTAEQIPKHCCDDAGAAAPSDQTYGLTWHWHPSMVIGDSLEHDSKVGAVVDASEVCGAGGKREEVGGPGKQAECFESANGGPQMLSPYTTDESVEFLECVVRDLVHVEFAAPCYHLLGGTPDADVHKSDKAGAIGPPKEVELLNRQKYKSTDRFARLHFRIGGCHMASLV